MPLHLETTALKRKVLYRANYTDGETCNLRVLKHHHAPKRQGYRKPKKQAAGQVIAMYAFSIFELNKNPAVEEQSFPRHFICSHLPPAEQSEVNKAVKLFHQFKDQYKAARYGRVLVNAVSEYRADFAKSACTDGNVIAVTRTCEEQQMLFIYNASPCEAKERFIQLGNELKAGEHALTALYGYESCSRVYVNKMTVNSKNSACIKLYLKPMHLVILRFP
ncbi:MAG TPA: hypothetical protein VHB48_13010 [Chitinophagaceae bacterium]|nr:hypothetical protein [Chitinophagaceae bacterium]